MNFKTELTQEQILRETKSIPFQIFFSKLANLFFFVDIQLSLGFSLQIFFFIFPSNLYSSFDTLEPENFETMQARNYHGQKTQRASLLLSGVFST